MAQLYCERCRKTMSDINFYQYKNGTKAELCKTCLTAHINNFEPDTFLWLLEKFDVPYVPSEWNVLRDRMYEKDPIKFGPMSVFGRYLAKMRLKNWKEFGWADSEMIVKEQEEKAKLYGNVNRKTAEELEAMRAAFEAGEISEAQYQTYVSLNKQPDEYLYNPETKEITRAGDYPANDNPFEQVEMPNFSEQLTAEDKLQMAIKWGQLYSASDWVYLEKKYKDFINSFTIEGAARIDTLLQVCKLSLKMNQALDTGDIDTYSKLYRAYDVLMKSAKFTEAQRKEDSSQDFNSIGEIVAFCEKEKGAIPKYEIKIARDIVDEDIADMKNYTKSLIETDSTVFKQIEAYIKKRDILAQQTADAEAAAAAGEAGVILDDEDFIDYRDSVEEQKEIDAGGDSE